MKFHDLQTAAWYNVRKHENPNLHGTQTLNKSEGIEHHVSYCGQDAEYQNCVSAV